jgi:S1-C subfamily serine protease
MLTAKLLALMLPFTWHALVAGEDVPRAIAPAQVRAATVLVRNRDKESTGSGVLVARGDGYVYVLTANHVVEGSDRLSVVTFTADEPPREQHTFAVVSVIARNSEADLAVLRFATRLELAAPLPLADAGNLPAVNDLKANYLGCAAGQPPRSQHAVITAAKRIRRGPAGSTCLAWELESKVATGISGGPLLTTSGHILGISSGNGDGRAYFTHLEEIHAFLKKVDLGKARLPTPQP